MGSDPEVRGVGHAPDLADPARWLDDHGDLLYGFALGRVGRPEVAEDLVQETLLAALRARGRFEGRSAVGTWLVSILRRKIADHYREAASAPRIDDPDAPEGRGREGIRERTFTAEGHWRHRPAPWPDPADPVERGEFLRVFERCMTDLPGVLSASFAARVVDDRSPEDICRELGITRANLRIRLHRARLLLRDCLERRWIGDGPVGGARSS